MPAARIYFDHNATTPIAKEVLSAMWPYLAEQHGNPSSIHAVGRTARQAVEQARRQVAELCSVSGDEIVFVSGGTEANNLALLPVARAARAKGRGQHVITGTLEHPSVSGCAAALEQEGFRVTRLPASAAGTIAPEALERAFAAGTVLVSVQLVNHELGTVQPVAQLAAYARAQGALFHCDAVQAAGKRPLDLRALGVDLASLSAHKIQGPKGTGALFVRTGVDAPSYLVGGHQERERRAGTENVAGIVGFGAAAALAREHLAASPVAMRALGDRLEAGLAALGGVVHGAASERVPGTTNVRFAGVLGEVLVQALDLSGVAASTGAACTSGSVEPSPVLLALGLERRAAAESVRLSLGVTNTCDEVDRVLALLPELLARARAAGE
jgi:cysteine desulfurase